MRVCVAMLVVLVSRSAYAGSDVGVVAVGEPSMLADLKSHVQHWIEAQGDTIVRTPLSRDALNTLVNCFVLEDVACARGVFETRARSFSLVYVGAEVDGKDTAFTVYWFAKGHAPVGEKQTCAQCDTNAWHVLVDGMLQRLSGTAKGTMGKLDVQSEPPGVSVLLDDVTIGVTPVVRDIPAGKHAVTLSSRGQPVGTRDVDIASGATTTVAMQVEIPGEPRHPRLVPLVLMASGLFVGAAGGVMIYVGGLDDADRKRIYPDLVPGGYALCAVGGGALLTGTVLLIRSGGGPSEPVAAVGPRGAYIGWSSRF